MMDIREKLVELLDEARAKRREICYAHTDCNSCVFGEEGENCGDKMIADHLLANGVTVQEWIPVSERLPEDREYVLFFDNIDMVHYGYLCAGDRWIDRCNEMYYYHVTHWMPLPQPPKGE